MTRRHWRRGREDEAFTSLQKRSANHSVIIAFSSGRATFDLGLLVSLPRNVAWLRRSTDLPSKVASLDCQTYSSVIRDQTIPPTTRTLPVEALCCHS